jgi:predicted RNA-binding protein with EMAP domain
LIENEISDVDNFDRIRVNLLQNVRSNFIVLEEDGTNNESLKVIKEKVESYIDYDQKLEDYDQKVEEESEELAIETLEIPYRE